MDKDFCKNENFRENGTWEVRQAEMSYFEADITNTMPKRYINLEQLYRQLTTDEQLKQVTERLRATTDEKEQKNIKRQQLPFVTFAGTFKQRLASELIKLSSLLCIDIDHLGSEEEVEQVRRRLLDDEFFTTELLFTSPRGRGVKWVTHIDLRRGDYPTWYRAVVRYLRERYQLQPDTAPANVASACFLCHDARAVVNPEVLGQPNPKPRNLSAFCLEQYAAQPVKSTAASATAQQHTTTATRQHATTATRQHATTSARHLATEKNPDDYAKALRVVECIEARHLDLTASYADWLNLGFALSDAFAESGRELYHRISRFYPRYNPTECDRKYDSCLHGNGQGVHLATFFELAKRGGIDLSEVCRELTSATTAIPPSGAEQSETPLDSVWGDQAVFATGDGMSAMTETPSLPELHPLGLTFADKLQPDGLPQLIRTIYNYFTDVETRDKMLLAAIDLISGVMTKAFYAIYDQRKLYAPLYTIVWGPPASSKGDLVAVKELVKRISHEKRSQYHAALTAYEVEKAQWDAMSKKERGPEPKEPDPSLLFIPANSSASAIIRLLAANDGTGIIYDTEADPLAFILENKEYGDWSDLLRKAFHHESVSLARVTEKLYIDIAEPYLALFLTCTGNQLKRLLSPSNVENGLATRILTYRLTQTQHRFRNVFASAERTLSNLFSELGDDVYRLHHALLDRLDNPIQFAFTNEQQERFISFFDELLSEQSTLQGDEIRGYIFRLALNGFRYAMVLGMLRAYAEWQRSGRDTLFLPIERTLLCDDRDFQTAITIVRCLYNHTCLVFPELHKGLADPFAHALDQPTEQQRRFFAQLPEGVEFQSKEVKELAARMRISSRTAERYLEEFVSKYCVLTKIKRGIYCKTSNNQHHEE